MIKLTIFIVIVSVIWALVWVGLQAITGWSWMTYWGVLPAMCVGGLSALYGVDRWL